MKRIGLFMLVLAFAVTAAAQDDIKQQPQQTQPPDYSRNKLIQILANEPPKPAERKVDFGFGYVDFRALGMRWKVGYLPIMMPLYGSVPWAMNGAFGGMPDPFVQTGTEIPYTPRTWREIRDMNAELKRIERTERAKEKEKPNATVTANPQ
jgi:hypothetical protein